MRRAFAKQIKDMESGMVMFQGANDGSTIIDHRNAKCMEVLKEEIAKGKRNIAIFLRCWAPARHAAAINKRFQNETRRARLV